MTARQKIEGLTNSWYGYAAFGALVSLWRGGLGLFSLAWAAALFVANVLLVWFIGRRLLARGSLTRAVLLLVTGLFSVLGAVTTAKLGYTFFQSWSLSVALYGFTAALGVYMNARSFKVLTDSSVKAYFNAGS
jgi:hypothetical protein